MLVPIRKFRSVRSNESPTWKNQSRFIELFCSQQSPSSLSAVRSNEAKSRVSPSRWAPSRSGAPSQGLWLPTVFANGECAADEITAHQSPPTVIAFPAW